MRAALLCLVLVLGGFAFAHIDDGDALLYAQLADNLRASHQYFSLFWTPTHLAHFSDHLPPPIWLIALCRAFAGDLGAKLIFAGLCVATWLVTAKLAERHGWEKAAVWAIFIAAGTESYARLQAVPRIDQPFILFFVLSLFVVRSGRVRDAALSGILCGLTILWRAPFALALLVLVPALVAVERARLGLPRLGRRDVAAAFCFLALAAAPALALHFADRAFGPGDLWSHYLHSQVWASLTGARPDGDSSHFGPWLALVKYFWPGLPFLLLAAHRSLVEPRSRWLNWLWLWVAVVMVGQSIGARYLAPHLWMAYPALLLLAGWGLQPWVSRFRWLPAALVGSAAVLAVVYPLVFTRARCDVARFVDHNDLANDCPEISVVTPDGNADWYIGARIGEHLRRDFVFTAAPLLSANCRTLAVSRRPLPAPWQLLEAGRQFSFYGSP